MAEQQLGTPVSDEDLEQAITRQQALEQQQIEGTPVPEVEVKRAITHEQYVSQQSDDTKQQSDQQLGTPVSNEDLEQAKTVSQMQDQQPVKQPKQDQQQLGTPVLDEQIEQALTVEDKQAREYPLRKLDRQDPAVLQVQEEIKQDGPSQVDPTWRAGQVTEQRTKQASEELQQNPERWDWGDEFIRELGQDWENLSGAAKQQYLQVIQADEDVQRKLRKKLIEDRQQHREDIDKGGKAFGAEFAADVVPFLIPGVGGFAAKTGQMMLTGGLKGGAEAAGKTPEEIRAEAGKTALLEGALAPFTIPKKTSGLGWTPGYIGAKKATRGVSQSRPVEGARGVVRRTFGKEAVDDPNWLRQGVDLAEEKVAASPIGRTIPIPWFRQQLTEAPLSSAAALSSYATGNLAPAGGATALLGISRARGVRAKVKQNIRKVPKQWRATMNKAVQRGENATAAALYVGQQRDSEMRDFVKQLEQDERQSELEQAEIGGTEVTDDDLEKAITHSEHKYD